MEYDANKNTWKSIAPSSGSKPQPRFGHVMMCYFQFFVIFGGESQSGKILGDLWVFDTIAEKWTFVLDTADSHELSHHGITGNIPSARAFSSSVTIPELGVAYITGGLLGHGVAWDIWGLKIERLIAYVEDNVKNPLENFWIEKEIKDSDKSYLCRENHVSALVSKDTFVVYGGKSIIQSMTNNLGINQKHEFVDQSYIFNVARSTLSLLEAVGNTLPSPRIRWGVLSSGGGLVILYGGYDLNGQGNFIDLWHFVVSGNKIEFKELDYKLDSDNLFMTWRHGFSLHYVRGIQDPVMIGGTYGNNQQSRALVSLPEKKCKNLQDYSLAQCSPCPRGSVYSGGACRWCTHDQYFKENDKNYFNSECRNCPLGLVGGYYMSCVPCQGGYIYDMNYPSFWRKCEENEICPIGTRYAFPTAGFSENIQEVRMDNLPELFNPHKKPFDHTSVVVIFLCVFWTLLLFIVIAIFISIWKERALFVFREMDNTYITGGSRKRVVGGIIVSFFIMIVSLVTIGFFVNYFMFNSKTVIYETKNPFLNRAYPSSYEFQIKLYTSRFLESDDTSDLNMVERTNLFNSPMPDLCRKNKISYNLSRYFGQAEEHNKVFSCQRLALSNGTDEYTLTLVINDIKDEAPEHAFVRFSVNSDYDQIFHFFKWEYWNIWRFYENIPISYSKLSGFVTPQMVTKSNKNITSAFRGQETSKLKFKLTPTHYGNEIDSLNFEGYQVYLEDYERGSVISKRNMADRDNAGINIELFSHVSDTLNHVQVQRVKSLLETIAYVFGFTAGFTGIAYILKHFLSKEEYFKGLDRECDTLFGSADSDRLSLTNVASRSDSQAPFDARRLSSPSKVENGMETDG
jgi:hypothetical protein